MRRTFEMVEQVLKNKARKSPNKSPVILVVDDDKDVLLVIERVMSTRGYIIIPIDNGKDAINLVKNVAIDLVLLDLKMPGIDGPDVLREIRQHDKDLPVIIVTAYPDSELLARAMEHGYIGLISKPLNEDALEHIERTYNIGKQA